MKSTKQAIIFALLLYIYFVAGYPDSRNPNLEYELIGNALQANSKPTIVPTTPRKPFVINPPPSNDPTTKTFAYNPKSKTWTLATQADPQPSEDALLWNQANDKWLTQTARI